MNWQEPDVHVRNSRQQLNMFSFAPSNKTGEIRRSRIHSNPYGCRRQDAMGQTYISYKDTHHQQQHQHHKHTCRRHVFACFSTLYPFLSILTSVCVCVCLFEEHHSYVLCVTIIMSVMRARAYHYCYQLNFLHSLYTHTLDSLDFKSCTLSRGLSIARFCKRNCLVGWCAL